jgi:hypothetical protein
MSEVSGEADPPAISHIVTVGEMLDAGVKLCYTEARAKRAKRETNTERFFESFGVMAKTACSIYEDLQTTSVASARVNNANSSELSYFLIGLYFLRNYPTREDLERAFDFSKGWIAAKCWEWVDRFAALKAEKIV